MLKDWCRLGMLGVVALLLQGCPVYVTSTYSPGVSPPAGPVLPDLSGYTTTAVEAMVPATTAASVLVTDLMTAPRFDLFLDTGIKPTWQALQGTPNPTAIFITAGIMTLGQLATEVNDANLLAVNGTEFTLHVPIFILGDATLIIAAPEVSVLKMSSVTGAFISANGDLFVLNCAVYGWDTVNDGGADYVDEDTFRPFFTNWSGSAMYFSNVHLDHLGYKASKRYAVSYSVTSEWRRDLIPTFDPPYAWTVDHSPPTGWMVDCVVNDCYYGFYCFEAEDITVIDCVFDANIVYGIDPHDYSTGLIFARNEVRNTLERDGIILSRYVEDSWVIDNLSEDNAISGIKIDRRSQNNVIANNTVQNNAGDGISIFESEDNIYWNNVVTGNERSGIRIRNSWDVVIRENTINNNEQYAVNGSAQLLESRPTDDPIDPYEVRVGATIEWNEMVGNGSGAVKMLDFETVSFAQNNTGLQFAETAYKGDLEEFATDIFTTTVVLGQGITLSATAK